MNRKLTYGSLSIVAASVLYACGGGGGGTAGIGGTGSAGIGGTGISADGAITGFGSVFVNGIRFDTDGANIMIDDTLASENDLALGMIVRVDGTVNARGADGSRTGNARNIRFDSVIEGPVATSPQANADGTEKTFSVLGVMVAVDERSTVFRSGVTFANVAINNRLDISGFFDANGVLRATYVALDEPAFSPGVSEVEARGVVENVNGNSFDLRLAPGVIIMVNINGSTNLSDLPNNMVVNGLRVEVEGTIASLGATTINAREVEDERFDDDVDNFSITGSISNFMSNTQFNIGNLPINASGARFSPASLGTNLGNGAVVQAEGRVVNGTLIADSIEQRRGNVEMESRVQAVDQANNVITMMFPNDQSINVNVTFSTQFDDDDDNGSQQFNINDIRTGELLEIEGYLVGGAVFASEIERDDDNNNIELQGPVGAFNPIEQSLTILGVTFTTNGGTEFEDDDNGISVSDFFSRVMIGDVVEIEDNGVGDGIADEVEFDDDGFGFSFNDFEDDDDDDDDS